MQAKDFDFENAWDEYDKAVKKALPRTATNVLEQIAAEGIAAKRWPDATRAFITRANVEKGIRDEEAKQWLPAFVKRVDAAPEEMQAVLQLYLAHVYREESRPWRWGGSEPTKLGGAAAKDLPPWAPERLNDSLEAQFAKVLSRADALKKLRTMDWYVVTAHGNMPSSCRPTLFDIAVHDIIEFYGETIPDKTLEKGLALFDKLIEFHQVDTNKDALADAELARIRYEREFAQLPKKERDARYAAALDDFIRKYLDVTSVGALAVYYRADLQNDAGELVAAHKTASAGAARWPKSIGGESCAGLMKTLERPYFNVETEATWTAPWPDIEITSKNITNVSFKLIPVSFKDIKKNIVWDDGYYRVMDEYMKLAKKSSGARKWNVSIEDPRDYKTHEKRVSVPTDLEPGHYILFAAMDDTFGDKKTPVFARIVTVTDLALAKSADNGCVRGRVWNAESGKPIAGATVECWERKNYRDLHCTRTLTTGADGSFAFYVQKISPYLRVVHGDNEVLSLDDEGTGELRSGKSNVDYVDLLTGRAIYRPGQTVHFKGIAYHADPDAKDFRVLPGKAVTVEFLDPNNKSAGKLSLTTNPWGSFQGDFTAPRDRLTGGYTIKARLDRGPYWARASADVKVEEYKRPKFLAEFKSSASDAVLGKQMTVNGRAVTYSGLPVQGALVKWRVSRRTAYAWWWSWFGGDKDDDNGPIAQGEAETDADGAFAVAFTPVASPTADLSGEPSFRFTVTAEVVDTAGETHVAETDFTIGTVAWRASASASNKSWLVVDGKSAVASVPLTVSLHSLNGEPVSGKGTVRVFTLKGPEKPVRKPVESRRDWYGRRNGKKSSEPWNWERWEQGTEVKSFEVETNEKGSWKGNVDLPSGAYRVAFEAKDPQGKDVKTFDSFAVFDTSAPKFPIAVPEFYRIRDYSVEAGDSIKIFWASGYATGYSRLTLTQNGKTLYDRMTDPAKPIHYVEFPVGEENRGEIYVETEFVRENRLYKDRSSVTVPWSNMKLKLERGHFTSKLHPGAKETWSFKVSAPAEMVALMYDKSLDAFINHYVGVRFSHHFTPDARMPDILVLQNEQGSLASLGGYFPGGAIMPQASWCRWNASTAPVSMYRRRYAGMLRKGVVEEAGMAETMMCMAAAPDGMESKKSVARNDSADAEAPEEREPEVVVRKNLQETAFFLPNLETDEDGRVSFTFNVPEALTGWKFIALAHDKGLRSGILSEDDIVTTKPLMVEPNSPRFTREGDDFLFAVKVTNTEDKPQKGTVSLAFEDAETLKPAAVGGGSQEFELKGRESRSFTFRVKIPDGQGFLKYTARAKGAEFSDGEEGWLPVLSRRILVREAVQLQVRGDGTRTFALSNLLASAGSDTIRNVDLTVRAVSRPAWYAVLSLPYLMEYPHECCEQTFSRYYANALGAFIANSDPRIRATFDKWSKTGADALKSPLETNEDLKTIALDSTPWVQEAAHESKARRRVGTLFGADRLASEQKRCMSKLVETRNGDGRWPWFPGGPSSDGITLYILTGFARLNRLTGAPYPEFFQSACKALDKEIVEDVERRVKRAKRMKIPFRVWSGDVSWLYMHSFEGVPEAHRKTKELLLDHIAEEWTELGLETQAYAAIVSYRMGSKSVAKDILASLKERAIVSDEMGMYWKRGAFFSSSLFAAPVSTQSVIIEAFWEVLRDAESVDACRAWLLKQKQTQNWSSTASTADAVYAIMLDGGTDLLAGDTLATVTLGGKEVPKENAEEGTGLYTYKVPVEEIKPEMGAITFSNDAKGGVAWGGVHWSYFEDVLKVRGHEPKELRVEKKYFRKVHGTQGTRLAPVEGELAVGDELVVRIELTSDRVFEYVHLQDERPACAEPVDVLSSYRWQDGVGYYQSTRDTATHYYIDRLGKGTFVLETSFRVQQSGTFVGGLATVQCMYAPEFTAHSSAERITSSPR